MDIREYIGYDPESGNLTWKKASSKNTKIGSIITCINGDGYIIVGFNKRRYQAHRLCWFLHHRVWPDGVIDHINRIRDDNRICNLRVTDTRGNNQNKDNFNWGACYHKTNKKWVSNVTLRGNRIHLGSYDSEREAQDAYKEFLKRIGN